uniref:Delta5 desaturase n=1 Tax=Parietichytrium sp. TaxID=1689869 RepID=A0A809VKJ3_9STRA|nr:delta5 desaturase [Parietichytrium sp.]
MGRGAQGEPRQATELKSSPSEQRKVLLIDGQLYDATNFRHPGGSIIKYLCTDGKEVVDATEAYKEFHCRSSKADKYLNSLPKIDGPIKYKYDAKEQARHDKLTREYVALREQLVKEGYFDPSPLHIIYRCAELAAMFALSFYLFSFKGNVVATIAAIVIGGCVQGRCGWLMHEAGHYSMTGNIPVDLRLQEFLYGIGCGMSGAWWRSQHNKHHATPQKLKHDVDLDTLPLVAWNEKIARRVKPGSFQAKWLHLQGYIFAPVSCLLVGFFWTLYLHPRHMVRTKRNFEIFSVALRYVCWFSLLLSMGYTVGESLGLYVLTFGLGCTYIFTHFAVSHTHLPVSEEDEYLHWVEYAALHTTNVAIDSYVVTWLMSYLNFQIEHHLFPCCPQFRHPAISSRVKKLFEDNGLVYDARSYVQALKDTFGNLHEVGVNAGQAAKSE